MNHLTSTALSLERLLFCHTLNVPCQAGKLQVYMTIHETRDRSRNHQSDHVWLWLGSKHCFLHRNGPVDLCIASIIWFFFMDSTLYIFVSTIFCMHHFCMLKWIKNRTVFIHEHSKTTINLRINLVFFVCYQSIYNKHIKLKSIKYLYVNYLCTRPFHTKSTAQMKYNKHLCSF